ncbi:efflux RND transporter periplasmic adaptor subunit [Psychrobacter sp. DAB_AL43B]|uniref:efflux RND transporter periplasmic adaptor subunit n=1 Tax=Psychrobacter sp. DAB_AL43B TaxID=1028416 RepID=UPI0009C22888|nr:HlyD family efflux transporter periplasmic adaptor subunit [Psychrobacter sp. DAB_AL43B]SLJ85586.1 secretion protein HlyD [Psychrobacter sp. DAB_AL43B]
MTFSIRSIGSIVLRSALLRKSSYVLSALLIIGCQPSPPTAEPVTAENSETVDTPLIITADSITMTPDHILSVKPTRYQPSLGLQGSIKPIKKVNLIAAQPLTVEQVLVSKNQWVKKGTPLFTVRRQATQIKPALSSNDSTDIDVGLNDIASDNEKIGVSETANRAATLSKKADTDANLTPSITNENDENSDNVQEATTAKQSSNLITVRASFSGRVENLSVQAGQQITADTPLLKLSDESELHFVATLPIEAESQISVGQTVNFTAEERIDKFTGQVSNLKTAGQPTQLFVYVNVVNNEVSRHQILPGMKVIGRVDYGQIEVGTIVPKRALHNVDLTVLHAPPYKPLRSLSAHIWIIGQDQRLTRQPIEVIEYDPLTKQYLIAGVSNDSLICLANLPIESEGKKVMVS